jgi:nitroreductase
MTSDRSPFPGGFSPDAPRGGTAGRDESTALTTALARGPNRKLVDRRRYESLLEVLERRSTARRFDPLHKIHDEDYRLILDAARLAPSGANTQPWQFIVITSGRMREAIAEQLTNEQRQRAAAGQGGGGTIDYGAVETAPGLMVVVADFRLSWAFPGLMNGTELDQRYHANAERVILQSVAAATTAAHLAAASLGFQSWWISVLGQEETQAALHKLLGVPADLTITDLMAFGRAAGPVTRRWKKSVADIASWDQFDMANFRSVAQIDAWMADVRRGTFSKKLK